MAPKTQFTTTDVIHMLGQYDLGKFVRSEPVQQGTVQTNLIIETSRERYVLRYYQVRSLESVSFERDLILYLTRMGYPCPALVPNKEGDFLGRFQNRPYAVFEFVEGEHLTTPTEKQYQALIQKAAELHQLSAGFNSPYTQQRWNYSPALCQKLAQDQAQILDNQQAYNKLSWLEDQLAALDLPPSLPQGICHGDFHFSNVLFQDGEFAALLDFDDANLTYLTFDLVGLIEHRAWPHERSILDLKVARDIVQEYMKHRKLSKIEGTHLFDVYQLSILFDCVWYFSRWEGENFRERMKIEALQALGRQRFLDSLFSVQA